MVAFIIYWAAIIACIAWGVLSIWFSVFYLSRKENGNLWAFAFFNVIAIIALAIVLLVYNFSFFRCIDCSSSYFRS